MTEESESVGKSSDDTIASMRVALQTKAKDIDALRGELKDAKEEIADLTARLTEAEGTIERSVGTMKAASDEIERLREAMAKAGPMMLDPDAPFVAKSRIRISETEFIEKGQQLPFDPKKPPTGYTGFVEGEHYERARIFKPAGAAAL